MFTLRIIVLKKWFYTNKINVMFNLVGKDLLYPLRQLDFIEKRALIEDKIDIKVYNTNSTYHIRYSCAIKLA